MLLTLSGAKKLLLKGFVICFFLFSLFILVLVLFYNSVCYFVAQLCFLFIQTISWSFQCCRLS